MTETKTTSTTSTTSTIKSAPFFMTALSHLISIIGQYGRDSREVSVTAVPGLTTLLDTALYRSNEGCLTATVCAADSVLAAILELKSIAKALLKAILISEIDVTSNSTGGSLKSNNGNSKRQSSGNNSSNNVNSGAIMRELAESFARFCLECANACIQKLTCDRFARSANLETDPIENDVRNFSNNSDSMPSSSTSLSDSSKQSQAQQHQHYNISSLHDNARLKQLNPCDCWESPRLFCPDYVWADEAILYCLKSLRLISKHRFLSSTDKQLDSISQQYFDVGNPQNFYPSSTSIGTSTSWMWPNLPSNCLQSAEQMYRLIRSDLPAKLCQFRAAVESETIASKRLYLVKCEYRAPFRAFLESLNLILRAPPLQLVNEYIELHNKNDQKDSSPTESKKGTMKPNLDSTPFPQDPTSTAESTPSELERRRTETQQDFSKCLHKNPYLVKALKMEQHLEMLEIAMSTNLLPFSDLARLLDSKKCRIVPCEGVLEASELPPLRELLYRLKSILVYDDIKSSHHYPGQVIPNNNAQSPGGHNSTGGSSRIHSNVDGVRQSCGIRPILVDIQGIVPREGSEIDPFDFSSRNDGENKDTTEMEDLIFVRLERFISQLQKLCIIIQTKGALLFLDKKDYEIPPTLIKKCNSFDSELFEAKFQDWWLLIKLQHAHLYGSDFKEFSSLNKDTIFSTVSELAQETRQREMEMSLALSSLSSLLNVKKKLESYEIDANNRFDVLNETVMEVCMREMNLKLILNKPQELLLHCEKGKSHFSENETFSSPYKKSYGGLELKKTSAVGLFGHRLIRAGERLPIG